MGMDGGGPNIKEPGTLLTIQKGGILGVSPTYLAACPAKYQDGTLYKSQVDFQFAKGFLATPDISKIEDTIGEVFAIDAPAAEPAPAAPAPPAAEPSAPAPAPPATVKLGQTVDQVVAILGQPEKSIDLGAKQIYVYKDLKVTFVNGKVSDVQ